MDWLRDILLLTFVISAAGMPGDFVLGDDCPDRLLEDAVYVKPRNQSDGSCHCVLIMTCYERVIIAQGPRQFIYPDECTGYATRTLEFDIDSWDINLRRENGMEAETTESFRLTSSDFLMNITCEFWPAPVPKVGGGGGGGGGRPKPPPQDIPPGFFTGFDPGLGSMQIIVIVLSVVLSVIVFIVLVVGACIAWRRYRKRQEKAAYSVCETPSTRGHSVLVRSASVTSGVYHTIEESSMASKLDAPPIPDPPTPYPPTADAPTPYATTTTLDALTTDAPTSDALTTDAPIPDAITPDAPTPDAPISDAPTSDAPTADPEKPEKLPKDPDNGELIRAGEIQIVPDSTKLDPNRDDGSGSVPSDSGYGDYYTTPAPVAKPRPNEYTTLGGAAALKSGSGNDVDPENMEDAEGKIHDPEHTSSIDTDTDADGRSLGKEDSTETEKKTDGEEIQFDPDSTKLDPERDDGSGSLPSDSGYGDYYTTPAPVVKPRPNEYTTLGGVAVLTSGPSGSENNAAPEEDVEEEEEDMTRAPDGGSSTKEDDVTETEKASITATLKGIHPYPTHTSEHDSQAFLNDDGLADDRDSAIDPDCCKDPEQDCLEPDYTRPEPVEGPRGPNVYASLDKTMIRDVSVPEYLELIEEEGTQSRLETDEMVGKKPAVVDA